MPRIITPPDLMHEEVPKVLIRNAEWDDEFLQKLAETLSTKEYDIYVYADSKNDIQWFEGIRSKARVVIDANQYTGQDPLVWLVDFDKGFEV